MVLTKAVDHSKIESLPFKKTFGLQGAKWQQ
jgi:hypothetical protein